MASVWVTVLFWQLLTVQFGYLNDNIYDKR